MRGYRVGVAAHPVSDVRASLDVLVEWGRRHGVEIVARDGDLRGPRVGHPGVIHLDAPRFAETVDSVVSLGGDGTFLGAMRAQADRPVPILGVNHGSRGFLIEVQPHQLPAALDRLVRGDFTLETHPCLCVDVTRNGDDDGPGDVGAGSAVAFNDLAVARRGGGSAVRAVLRVDGAEYGYYSCDAVVLATPIGSTAYSYAAGGPVLSPATSSMVVTPVAPMSGLGRAVVLSDDDRVEFALTEGSCDLVVEADGIPVAEVSSGDVVRVSVRRDAGRVVRLDALSHARASMVQLSLLGVPLRGEQLRGVVPDGVSQAIAPDSLRPR